MYILYYDIIIYSDIVPVYVRRNPIVDDKPHEGHQQ
jgi:hypothetical protein